MKLNFCLRNLGDIYNELMIGLGVRLRVDSEFNFELDF